MTLTLTDLSKAIEDRKRVPVGFFVSTAIWSQLKKHIQNGEPTLIGAKVVLDPALPDSEFEVAFTEAAWSKRLSSLSHPNQRVPE